MTITLQQMLLVITGASSITTAIFWGAFLLGRLHSRMERTEKDVVGLGNRMDRAGDKMSDLADEMQKFPDRYLTRAEALHWRGSRAEDHS
jgi:hypothetical protein